MSLVAQVKGRVLEPAVLRVYQWRGDPVARLLSPETSRPLPAVGRSPSPRPLFRSPLGVVRRRVTPRRPRCCATGGSAPHRSTRAATSRRLPARRSARRAPRGGPAHFGPPRPHPSAPAGVRGVHPQVIADLEPWIREVTDRLLDRPHARPASTSSRHSPSRFPSRSSATCSASRSKTRPSSAPGATTSPPPSSRTPRRPPQPSHARRSSPLPHTCRIWWKRRTEPDGSLLSSLVEAEEEGDRLSSGELVHGAAASRRRLRDHRQPDRQWHGRSPR